MTTSLTRLLIFCLPLLLIGCGADKAETNDDVATAAEVPPAPKSDVFNAAAEALETDRGPKEVTDLLLANFKFVSNEAGELDDAAIAQYMAVVNQLTRKYPDDTLVAPALYRSADLLRAKGADVQVANVYHKLRTDYPSYSKAGEALFMEAFTYDENLKDYEKAKPLYEKFIEEYPGHTFADDARIMLNNLGKSSEEMIRGLEQ